MGNDLEPVDAAGAEVAEGPSAARRPLSRQRIITAALRLVDAEGVGALSMRRLAAELGGFEAMSLYSHVANKAEVLDGIVEAVWSEFRLPSQGLDSWARLWELARTWRNLGHVHPHVFSLLATRLVDSVPARRPVEFALQTLRDAGFDEPSALPAFRTLVAYVYGYTAGELIRMSAQDRSKGELSGAPLKTNPQSGPIVELTQYLGSVDGDQPFNWGLEVTLSGLKAKVSSGASVGRKGRSGGTASPTG